MKENENVLNHSTEKLKKSFSLKNLQSRKTFPWNFEAILHAKHFLVISKETHDGGCDLLNSYLITLLRVYFG